MLKYIDIAIGFTVVMLGVSIIIMTLTQVVSSLFGYRASVIT